MIVTTLAFAFVLQATDAPYWLTAPGGLPAATLVCSDEDKVWNAYFQAVANKDYPTLLSMIELGLTCRVQVQTRVQVLKSGFISKKVRVMEGKNKGIEGWVENNYLTAIPQPTSKIVCGFLTDLI